MGKGIPHFLRRPFTQTKPHRKILLLIPALIGNVGGIINDDIEERILEGCACVICDDGGTVGTVCIQANNLSLTSSPEPTAVDCGVQDAVGRLSRIEAK